MTLGEFELIGTILEALSDTISGEGVVVGPGDDCAVVEVPPGHELVVTTDVLVEGRHFPKNSRSDLVGYRSVAVNLSDLAAMGSDPKYLTVAITIEKPDKDWIVQFANGVAFCAREAGVKIIGGNVARGPLSIAITAHGIVPQGRAILRSGAQVDDEIYVTGFVGGAGQALQDIDSLIDMGDQAIETLATLREQELRCRYFLPQPRLRLGCGLRSIATSAIDISDGLLADLQHITTASSVGACIDLDRVPIWPGTDVLEAVGAGDDYELLFTANASQKNGIRDLIAQTGTSIECIGSVTELPTIEVLQGGKPVRPASGFTHF